MSIVTIKLSNKSFQLSCPKESEEQLQNLSTKLNQRIAEIKLANPSAPFDLLLVMLALGLQDEMQNAESKLGKINKVNDEDEKFAETLSTIAGYLENLAQKIGK